MNILQNLKIFGLDMIEDAILAGLVTGDPVLLIGRHGSAKTLLAKRIAQALGMKFIAYDASKSLFEDVIGFPNPKSLSKGMIDYVPTEISIWDKEFILIDEISRATPSMQNKWLEIIRSRQVMGKPIPNLKYIFSAMNPPASYVGAIPLDPALAGRFALIITLPEVEMMDETDIRNIINHISEDDAVALQKANILKPVSIGDDIKEFISKAQKLVPEKSEKYTSLIDNYLINVLELSEVNNIKLDGRRLGMLKRNILAYLAVKTVKYGGNSVNQNLFNYFLECLTYSLPYEAIGVTIRKDVINLIHFSAVKNINSFTIKKNRKPACDTLTGMAEDYIKFYNSVSDDQHNEIVEKISKKYKNVSTEEDLIDIYFAVRTLVKFYISNRFKKMKNKKNFVDVKRRIFDLYTELTSITSKIREAEDDIIHNAFVDKEKISRNYNEIYFDNLPTDVAFRLILNANTSHKYYRPLTQNKINFNLLKEKISYRINQTRVI